MTTPAAGSPHDALAARIAAWLPRARWYADKGVAADRVTVADAVAVGDTSLALVLLDVQSAGAVASRYVVPVETVAGTDAACVPACADWLVHAVLEGGSFAGKHGLFVGRPIAAPSGSHPVAAAAAGPTTVVPIGHDASNTSFVVGTGDRRLIVKVFRRCRSGIQPEVEVGEFFAIHAPWPAAARLRGWLEYRPHDDPDGAAALAVVHDFGADRTAAWDRLVALLSDGGLAGRHGQRIRGIAAALGRATGEMHAALGSRPDLPAFAPESATRARRRATAAALVDHAAGVFALARSRAATLPAPLGARLLRVADRGPEFLDRLRGLADSDAVAALIRVHGDYHLGQVLLGNADDGVTVIDFEGEPARPLEERRAKADAGKDVAGMCRSFDYLLRHVARSTGAAYRHDDRLALEAAFLEAYTALAAGRPWWPADRRAADSLLAIHMLDKAVYELAYELRSRPDWIDVPLAALEAQG